MIASRPEQTEFCPHSCDKLTEFFLRLRSPILSLTEFHRIFSAFGESILSVTEFDRIISAFSD
jgi:hypothetical protein